MPGAAAGPMAPSCATTGREFAPAEYLPGRSPPQGLLAPGARADADLSLADPGSQAVGFELDVCLQRDGALACGNDPTLAGG